MVDICVSEVVNNALVAFAPDSAVEFAKEAMYSHNTGP